MHRFAAPTKLYEAMMLAKPVILNRGCGLEEWVEERNVGWLVDYGDADALRRLLVRLAGDSNEVRLKGRAARKAFEAHCSDERAKTQLLEAMQAAVSDLP